MQLDIVTVEVFVRYCERERPSYREVFDRMMALHIRG